MKLIETIRKKIASRRERKAKLNKFADMIDFGEVDGHKFIDLSESLVSRKCLSAAGMNKPAFPAYIWQDKEGIIHFGGSIVVHGDILTRP